MNIDKACKLCGGTRIHWDSMAVWSTSKQELVLGDYIAAQAYCADCDCDTEVTDIPLSDSGNITLTPVKG